MARRFGAEIVHFTTTPTVRTERVFVGAVRRFDTEEVHSVATRRPSAKEVYAQTPYRLGMRKVYISGSGA